jgi:hypothetical protein
MSLSQWAGGRRKALSGTHHSGPEPAAKMAAKGAAQGAFATLQYMQPPGQGQQGELPWSGQNGQRGFPQPFCALNWLPSSSSAQASESSSHVPSLASQRESLHKARGAEEGQGGASKRAVTPIGSLAMRKTNRLVRETKRVD